MENGRPIGGWLILFGIGLIASTIILLIYLFSELPNVMEYDVSYLNSIYNDEEVSLIFVTTIYPFVSILILLVFNLFLIYLYFTKHKEFPKAYIYLNISMAIIIMSFDFISALSGAVVYFENTAGAVISLILWSAYLLNSQRVKETFVLTKRKKYIKISEEEYELFKQKMNS
ncbi:DUF2569 family protein [Neobacillus sp. 179-J 1A1 HS]|uniref:DUF2569 family protein n=1 Tax=Neobacillus driksii TaxID=3035913 RepID=UPI0035BBF2DB